MKIRRRQHNGSAWRNQTTIMLESVTEAIGLVETLLKSTEKQIGAGDLKGSKLIDDLFDIYGSNSSYVKRGFTSFKSMSEQYGGLKSQLNDAIKQIYHGPNQETMREINEWIERLRYMAIDIEPTLSLGKHLIAVENADIWNAEKVMDDSCDRPCYVHDKFTPKSGMGDGAYRILINTDVSCFGDPTYQCAALCALIQILQEANPVEIWIQQGWMGNISNIEDEEDCETGEMLVDAERLKHIVKKKFNPNGVTLFPMHKGGAVSPQHLWFWIGSHYKDSPFSWAVNRALGRINSGVSQSAEIPCDLYIYNEHMPVISSDDEGAQKLAEWVAHTAHKIMFESQDPEMLQEKE